MIHARFEGGPFDGADLGLAGATPGYLLLMPHPTDPDYPMPLIVGADFDDHWPGQQRYVLDVIHTGGPGPATAVYRHREEAV